MLIVGLIVLSGDLGVALVYMGMIVFMLYFAGLSGWYFLGAAGALTVSLPFLWTVLRPDQQNRIIYGFMPELDPTNWGRQALISRDAIASGGFFGRGSAEGGIYEILPEHHTYFILATICEKFGLVVGILTVVALVVIVLRLLWIALTCREFVGRPICGGIAAMIIVQTLENLWMCLAMVPVIGITLPFLSYGGSSVLALYMLMGLAHSVYAQEHKLFFGRDR
jgi:rod shape determining protein RodA